MTPDQSQSPAGPARPAAGILLALITGCLMLQPLSTDLYLPSLPHLARYFEVSPAMVQQTLSLFVIGFGTAQLLIGPLSDRYGRRPVLLGGLIVYVAASVACALAGTMGALIAARFCQALGCCTAVVIARAVIRDAYPPGEGARVIAQASSLLAAAPILGPAAGGYLQIAFGWRAAFVVLTAFALALTFAIWRRLGETNRHKTPEATRPSGLLRSYRAILRSPTFWAYTAPGAFSYASIFVFISGASFVLISVLKMPTEYFGLAFGFGVVGYLLGTLLCRRLLRKIGIARTLTMGTVLSAAAGLLFLALVAAGVHHWATVLACLFLCMFAHGINFPCAQTGAVAPFPRQAGAAAGLFGFFLMFAAFLIGTSVGASHDGTLYPLSFISAAVGIAVLAVAQLSSRHRALTTT
jgi:DHA1 family bicyclomycin/chloramphenicol resistance-like MFS transporter